MRRDRFLTDGWKQLLGSVLKSPVGESVDHTLLAFSNLLAPQTLADRVEALQAPRRLNPGRSYPRPPGALEDPQAFEEACTRCGDCVFACPYGAIRATSPQSGPLLDPNIEACRLCPDFPCINACHEGALLPLAKDELPKFGTAGLLWENCLNEPDARTARLNAAGKTKERFCRECAKACPVEGAVSVGRNGQPEFYDHCTGCGVCVQACPTSPVAIRVAWDPDD